jgi:hypothetical protein
MSISCGHILMSASGIADCCHRERTFFILVPADSGLRTDRPTTQNVNTSDGVKMCFYGLEIFAKIVKEQVCADDV